MTTPAENFSPTTPGQVLIDANRTMYYSVAFDRWITLDWEGVSLSVPQTISPHGLQYLREDGTIGVTFVEPGELQLALVYTPSNGRLTKQYLSSVRIHLA